MSKVLILTDGKAGHENQSRAFARALGCSAEVVPVRFRGKFAKPLSYLLDHLGIRTTHLFDPINLAACASEPPVAVLGTGSGTFYAVKAVARRLRVPAAVVLYPRGYDMASFDCVLAPSFDRPRKAFNVVEIPANLVAADAAFYAEGVAAFERHYAETTGHARPSAEAVAVIVGGPNKCSTMTPEWMKAQLDAVFAQPVSAGASREYWVTTSRRTPPAVEAVVEQYPWNYRLIYSRDHFNPIPAFVSLANRLYVTAESTGMLSEACTSGKAEVVALDNLKAGPHKFRRFVDNLRAAGYVDGSRKINLAEQFAMARQLLGL